MHAAAPILCAGVTVYKALKEIGGNCGDFVVIPGAGGGLGHLACQYARSMGYRVIAIDSGDDKRKLVASYGIKDFIDFKEGNVKEKVFEATEGRGAHASVVVASGGDAYADALSFLRPHGAVVLVGLPKDTYITAEVFGSVLNSHRIIGSYVGNRQDSIEALKLAAAGDVTTTYTIEKLDNLPSVFERMAAGKLAGRIVLDCELHRNWQEENALTLAGALAPSAHSVVKDCPPLVVAVGLVELAPIPVGDAVASTYFCIVIFASSGGAAAKAYVSGDPDGEE
ncbi:unnamed protein product [Phytophthora fragariaefolia]|uniref:Unnamed protein product n=1 Tax=Phytophthora fragariaefolia TaxID=1490495 RepID=A0A9W6YDL8_9STRA|nr:unnamed protein product [Phytophthora fragariaefolia]